MTMQEANDELILQSFHSSVLQPRGQCHVRHPCSHVHEPSSRPHPWTCTSSRGPAALRGAGPGHLARPASQHPEARQDRAHTRDLRDPGTRSARGQHAAPRPRHRLRPARLRRHRDGLSHPPRREARRRRRPERAGRGARCARAQCLRTVFGAGSQYDIGHIMAQTPQSGMKSPASPPSEIHLGKTMEQGADGVVQTAHSSAPTTRSSPWRETWA